MLEIHPHDAEVRGIAEGQMVSLASRVGATTLRALISERMPQGVVYTTFHHPVTGANVITTEHSDWATNCPEYKVTAVQVTLSNQPSEWQKEWENREDENKRIEVETPCRGGVRSRKARHPAPAGHLSHGQGATGEGDSHQAPSPVRAWEKVAEGRMRASSNQSPRPAFCTPRPAP